LEKLNDVNFYQPTSDLEAHREHISSEFKAIPPRTINEAVERVAELTGIRRSPTQLRRFLKGLGLKRLKVGQIPAKADADQQEAFLEAELEPRLEEARQGKRHLFFADGVHFVFQAFLGFLWCFKRVFIPAPTGRQRLSVLGVLHAITHQVLNVVTEDYINANTVIALLDKLKAAYGDLPITVVLDNARYQHCQAVLQFAAQLGIELLFLPPYSPNLNLIERLWKFVKKTCLYSRCYETFGAFKESILACLNETQGKHKAKLATLLTLNFQIVRSETL
jgi:transposase